MLHAHITTTTLCLLPLLYISESQSASFSTLILPPRVIFKVEDPVRLQVCLAVDTPNVKYAHDIAIAQVDFEK